MTWRYYAGPVRDCLALRPCPSPQHSRAAQLPQRSIHDPSPYSELIQYHHSHITQLAQASDPVLSHPPLLWPSDPVWRVPLVYERGTLYTVDTSNSVRTSGALHLIGRLPGVQSLGDGYRGFFISASLLQPLAKINGPLTFLTFSPPSVPFPDQREPTRSITAHRILSVFG